MKQKLPSSRSSSDDKPTIIDLETHLNTNDSWQFWRFRVNTQLMFSGFKYRFAQDKPKKISAKINLLQAAILLQDIKLVKIITKVAKEKGALFANQILTFEADLNIDEGWILANCCKWILKSSSIHFATYCHPESLIHLLEFEPSLINRQTGSEQQLRLCVY